MKDDTWTWRPLGELFEIGAGKTMSAAARGGAAKTPFLRTSNVLWDEIDISVVDEMAIPPHELAEKLVQPGDLLVCEGGEIGRAAIWNGEIETMSFQNHLHRLRPIDDAVEPRFYVYFLQSAFTQLGIFEGAGNKTTIPNLSRSRLAALDVPYPSHDEQKAIVRALALIRSAIKTHHHATTVAQELKRTTMRELFTHGLRGHGPKETEIGSLPEDWRVEQLGPHLIRAQYGLSVKGHPSGQHPILRMNCQIDGRVVFRDLQYVDLEPKMFEAFRVADGDLLFNRTNSYELVGRTAIFRSARDAVFASYLIRLTLDPDAFVPEFVNYFFNRESTQAELKKLASRGVSQANISASKLKEFLVPWAPLDEQHDIVKVIEAIDRKIDLHKRKRDVLDELFRSLLHKLMTGEIRVNDLSISEIAQ